VRREALRAFPGSRRHPGWPLRAPAPHQSRRSDASRCRSCASCPSRRRSLSGTNAARSASRRLWSRCTWPASPSAGSRTSPRRCGAHGCPSTVSELNQKIAVQIEEWRNRPLTGQHPYVFLDGIWLKRSWGGEVKNVSILVAIGVDQDGYREVLGVMEGAKEDKASWVNFMRHLKERGLAGVRLFISDKCLGLVSSLAEFYPDALWQRCAVHFYRDVCGGADIKGARGGCHA
jgi:hypothetical protein